jgi:hypothetical protein
MRPLQYSAALLSAGLFPYAYAASALVAEIPFNMCHGLLVAVQPRATAIANP